MATANATPVPTKIFLMGMSLLQPHSRPFANRQIEGHASIVECFFERVHDESDWFSRAALEVGHRAFTYAGTTGEVVLRPTK